MKSNSTAQARDGDGREQVPRQAPGPGAWEIIRKMRRMMAGGSIDELPQMTRRFGHVVRFSLLGKQSFIITDPNLVREMLVDRHQEFQKSLNYRQLALILGNGLLNSEGELWKRQRKLMQPAFHRSRLEKFAAGMVRDTQEMLENWGKLSSDDVIEITREMSRLTFEIVGHSLFSTDVKDFTDLAGDALHFAMDYVNRRTITPFNVPTRLPTRKNRRFRATMKLLNRIVNDIIRSRRSPTNAPQDDLLALLMQARDDESGKGMSDQQLRDEVMTFVLAGHETTANTLAWTLYLVSEHPEVRTRLEQEVDEILKGEAPKLEDLPRLQWTRQVIEESMRLYPAAWLIERRPLQDTVLGGYSVPKDATLMIFTYMLHRHPDFWPDAEKFQPERFGAEALSRHHPYAFLPFSHGPRQCIGAQFAMTEAQIILAMITQQFRLQLVPGQVIEPEPSVTLRPRYGVKVRLEKRIT